MDWEIHSRSEDYVVYVADCSEEHARSVLNSLIHNPDVPNDLRLEAPDEGPVKKFRRRLNG